METFTATCISVSPSAVHAASWAIALSSAHSPISTISPVSSAIGMNRAGVTAPRRGMVPAHQRLDTADPSGHEVDDGLVDEVELPAVQRAAEIVGELGAFLLRHLEARLEHRPPPAAVPLGAVHRDVGAPDQLAALDPRSGHRDPDARPELHLALARSDVDRLGDGEHEPVGDPLRVGRPGSGDDDGELVTAEPRRVVAAAQHLAHPSTDALQDLVAGVVAEAVVDPLEPVEVEEQHGDRAGSCDQLIDQLGEAGAVRQPGQRIGDALLLAHPPRDDVHRGCGEHERRRG